MRRSFTAGCFGSLGVALAVRILWLLAAIVLAFATRCNPDATAARSRLLPPPRPA